MNGSHWPLLLIEGVLVFGGALAFGWWQLRSIDRDQREARRRRDAQGLSPDRERGAGDARDVNSN